MHFLTNKIIQSKSCRQDFSSSDQISAEEVNNELAFIIVYCGNKKIVGGILLHTFVNYLLVRFRSQHLPRIPNSNIFDIINVRNAGILAKFKTHVYLEIN